MRTLALLTFPALCAGLLLISACGSRPTESSPTPGDPDAGPVARLDDHRYLGASFDVDKLRIWPVHTTQPLDVGEFLTLQEAQEAGTASVREIGGAQAGGRAANDQARQVDAGPAQNDAIGSSLSFEGPRQNGVIGGSEQVVQSLGGGAQVGTLAIENKGDLPLLVCAGTIVKGGNQDRQIGQDIVVAAGETVPVDAFCVEAGRWTSVREGVSNTGEFVAMKAFASKNVRAKGQYEDDQSGVWQEVEVARRQSLSPESPGAGGGGGAEAITAGTTFVDALEKATPEKQQARKATVDTILARFGALADGDSPPVGFAYAVNGKPQVVRVFAHDRLLRKNLEAFATTMAVEAEAAGESEHEPCSADDIVAMIEAIEKDAQQKREQTAANVNVLRSNDAGFNGNCYVEDESGEEIPLTQDWTKK